MMAERRLGAEMDAEETLKLMEHGAQWSEYTGTFFDMVSGDWQAWKNGSRLGWFATRDAAQAAIYEQSEREVDHQRGSGQW